MCGIFCSVSAAGHIVPSARHRDLLQRRGPDSSKELKQQSGNVYLTCFSTVLALRGDHTVIQPVQHSEYPDSFLCWNGEAWKYDSTPILGNDSEIVFASVSRLFANCAVSSSPSSIMQNALSHITGPYAFAYFDSKSDTLFFGRDPLGRRSLMYRVDENGSFILSTISDSTEKGWEEVEADGIYSLNLGSFDESMQQKESSKPTCIPYLHSPNTVVSSASTSDTSASPLITSSPSVFKIEDLLRRSLDLRISNIPSHSQAVSSQIPASLAVLFSGGLDCTLLARVSHDTLDPSQPIDLLNVAFENPRVHRRPANADSDEPWSPFELCPDRITGRASFAELQTTCPSRTWRFVAINVPYQEFLTHRTEVISLIYPHNTEMDLSIASALYFASRGQGVVLSESQEATSYTSEARVLLSGLGADELFGGYTRHDTAFRRHGFTGLLEELNLDVERLGKRNLGRDDRVLSNWARETRFPFLDEDLVSWAVNAPVWERCGFGEGQTTLDSETGTLEPAKKVLRCLAWKLGMKNVAAEKKRAVSLVVHYFYRFTDNFYRFNSALVQPKWKSVNRKEHTLSHKIMYKQSMRQVTEEDLWCPHTSCLQPHLPFLVSLSSGL